MQAFTTDLYRFLLDHMHQGLNKVFTSPLTAAVFLGGAEKEEAQKGSLTH